MELSGWQECQRKQCSGTLSLLPPLSDFISSIYSQLLKLLYQTPCNNLKKRVVVYFAYKGTTVEIDLGDVRAAGVVCVLGLGAGLGTLVIYRLYHYYVRPFLDLKYQDPEQPPSAQNNSDLDSSDSGVDGAMGNNSSGPTPAVYYSPDYGVALGRRTRPPKEQEEIDSIRFRRMGASQKPVPRVISERDSNFSRSPNLASPTYEVTAKESFYSTAESGFETLPELNEEDEAESGEELSLSLRENLSVSSLKERSDRYFASLQNEGEGASPTAENTDPLLDQGEVSGDLSIPAVHTEPASSSDKSSSLHSGERVPDAHLLSVRKGNNVLNNEDFEEDPSLEVSESLRSFNSSGEEWSWEDEDKDMSPYPPSQMAMTDSQFRQSLMQRIREWSTFAEDYGKSPSPLLDASARLRRIGRSRSLDQHLSEAIIVPEVDMSSTETTSGQDSTIKSLENLETEFHDIQGEFESITSKLHELIEKVADQESQQSCTTNQESDQKSAARSSPVLHQIPPLPRPYLVSRPRALNTSLHQRPPRTKWEHMPSTLRSDSSCSSRNSSVDYSWDCGEVGIPLLQRLRGRPEVPGEPSGEGILEDEDCRVTSIGKAVPIVDYTAQEWKGDTSKAETIRQGYKAIPELFKCHHLRQIRGDNYCALRSTIFQVLVEGHRVMHRWPGLISIVEKLHELNADSSSGLQLWNFGRRLTWEGEEEKFSIIAQCILSLYVMIEEISALPTTEERLTRTLCLLNSSERFDTELMEGLKLMMLFRASDLQQEMQQEGAEVPTFAWLLFARDTSQDVLSFVRNHLNCVGDSAGIDQVEMCLLGHCLGVRLRVARLDHHGQQDFDCVFPDEASDDWPSICLIAEDDRHYNVPVA